MLETLAHATMEPGSRLRFSAVDWRTYTRYLKMFAESPGVRLTYDRGELEIMSPLFRHDFAGRCLGHLIAMLTKERGLPLVPGGSTTLRAKLKKRGLEPDECFWITNASRMKGKKRLDLSTDPPPDLAIEVDVTNSSLDRMAIYEDLGVPEVWRVDETGVSLVRLDRARRYRAQSKSRLFPEIDAEFIDTFLKQVAKSGDIHVVLDRLRRRLKKSRDDEK